MNFKQDYRSLLSQQVKTCLLLYKLYLIIKIFLYFNGISGKIKYEKWRDFESERRLESNKYFIDGDLIETYLDLSQSDAENLIKDFKIENISSGHNNEEFNVSYFNKLVEELTRLH